MLLYRILLSALHACCRSMWLLREGELVQHAPPASSSVLLKKRDAAAASAICPERMAQVQRAASGAPAAGARRAASGEGS